MPRKPQTSGVSTLNAILADWWAWLDSRERPITLVVDALDESSDPFGLLTALLERLDPHDAAKRRLRLMIGIRSPGGAGENADRPSTKGLPLADLAEQRLRAERLRVDEAPWWRDDDITDYVCEILIKTPKSPYADAADGLVERIGSTIAAHAGRSFLIARIAATSLSHRKDVVDPEDPTWIRSIDHGVIGVFRADLHATLPNPDDRLRAIYLLRAVAFAFGRGLPWRQIWPIVATAVADDETQYGDSDIAWLLQSRMGAYLISDSEDDVTVYRLFHGALRDTLRAHWQDMLEWQAT